MRPASRFAFGIAGRVGRGRRRPRPRPAGAITADAGRDRAGAGRRELAAPRLGWILVPIARARDLPVEPFRGSPMSGFTAAWSDYFRDRFQRRAPEERRFHLRGHGHARRSHRHGRRARGWRDLCAFGPAPGCSRCGTDRPCSSSISGPTCQRRRSRRAWRRRGAINPSRTCSAKPPGLSPVGIALLREGGRIALPPEPEKCGHQGASRSRSPAFGRIDRAISPRRHRRSGDSTNA